MKLPLFSLALGVVAVGLVIYGYSRDGFGLGALAVFFLWWADNDRKQSGAKERENQLIAENVPELVGKDFVHASTYILDAIDKFKAGASANAQQRFFDALTQHQAEWTRHGTPMPQWATLKLLREVETEFSNVNGAKNED